MNIIKSFFSFSDPGEPVVRAVLFQPEYQLFRRMRGGTLRRLATGSRSYVQREMQRTNFTSYDLISPRGLREALSRNDVEYQLALG